MSDFVHCLFFDDHRFFSVVKLVVVAWDDDVQYNTGDGCDSQTREVDAQVTRKNEGNTAGRAEAQSADKDDCRNDQIAGLVKSTLFSTTLRTPMAEIIP